MNRLLAPATAAALIGSIVLANYLSSEYGMVTAGFGLMVSAGTYAAGLSLGLRDALHEVGGVRWVLAAIAGGIAVSFLLGDGRIALASAVAFGVAEMLDLVVYSRLRRPASRPAPRLIRDGSGRGAYAPAQPATPSRWRAAVIASNAIGAVVDTVLFLAIAGFPLTPQAIGGQILVKAVWLTALAILVGEGIVRSRRLAAA